MSKELEAIVAEMRRKADMAYCDYIRKMQSPECLGWEAKVNTGKFGSEELRAHVAAGELLSRHRALHEAAEALSTQAGEGWRDIATAPKDECVLAYGPTWGHAVAMRTDDGIWVDDDLRPRSLTHWRPLPSPPSPPSDTKGESGG